MAPGATQLWLHNKQSSLKPLLWVKLLEAAVNRSIWVVWHYRNLRNTVPGVFSPVLAKHSNPNQCSLAVSSATRTLVDPVIEQL